MNFFISRFTRGTRWGLAAIFLGLSLRAQTPGPADPIVYDADSTALVLARKYLEGGEESRPAVLAALQHMGWGVRNAQNAMLKAPPAGTDTGLAMRDYELDELLWKPSEQPSIRLISFAQALAVPFGNADPEELAQDLVEAIRQGAESNHPQRRFWARFIIALGRVSPANYDLSASAPPLVMPPSRALVKSLEKEAATNPFAVMAALTPTPVWPEDDPVLAPSPRPGQDAGNARTGTA
ncbi:MAG TPA: hypothetical protein VHN79_06750, partial [Lacunisphaera sp.]|nr:hypothetical protein [Lacunisphaera sp.]